jgi:hypothetical protein
VKQICLHAGAETIGDGIESKFGATDMHSRRRREAVTGVAIDRYFIVIGEKSWNQF